MARAWTGAVSIPQRDTQPFPAALAAADGAGGFSGAGKAAAAFNPFPSYAKEGWRGLLPAEPAAPHGAKEKSSQPGRKIKGDAECCVCKHGLNNLGNVSV